MNNTSLAGWEEEGVLEGVPPLLYAVMGIWASITGLTGFLANSIAIGLFCSSSKVSTGKHILNVVFYHFSKK